MVWNDAKDTGAEEIDDTSFNDGSDDENDVDDDNESKEEDGEDDKDESDDDESEDVEPLYKREDVDYDATWTKSIEKDL
jgi:hypothetical protein